MNSLVLTTLLMIGWGRPTPTIHDYCMDHLDHYASYEECYNEVSQNHVNEKRKPSFAAAFGRVLQGAGQGLTNRNRVNCTSHAFGSTIQTECH